MFDNRQPIDSGTLSDRLPAILVSGLVVGAGARQFRFGYILIAILMFAVGSIVGWYWR